MRFLEDPNEEGELMILTPEIEVPPLEFAREEDIVDGICNFNPEKSMKKGGQPDLVKSEFESPEAESVERVQVDLSTGYTEVYRGRSEDPSKYVIAALGTDGKVSIADPDGNISTSETPQMAVPEYTAVIETIRDELLGGVQEPERERSQFGLESPSEIYEEVISDGTYEVPEGDAIFTGFENTEGHNMFGGNNSKATELLEELDRIAEFFLEYEEDYNSNSTKSIIDLPTTPMRDKGDVYKFRIPDTGNDVSIVVDKSYRERDDKIEIDVVAFSDHDGNANYY